MNALHFLLPEFGIPVLQHDAVACERDEAAIAHARGFAEGSDAVRTEMAAALAERQLRHEQELAAARKAWVEDEGMALGQKIVSALAELEQNIGQSLHQIMVPFLEKIIPEAAMIELRNVIKMALQDDFEDVLHVSAPEDLVAELKASLESSGIAVVTEASSHVDVRVRAKVFSITTRIGKWTDDIQGVAA
jgi:hypothetical protein